MTTENRDKQKELWNEAKKTIKYFKFEKDSRVTVGFSNWELQKKKTPDFHNKDIMVDNIEFRSQIILKNQDEVEEYEFSTLSKRFMSAVAPYLETKNPKSDVIFLSIKKIGDKNSSQYDVEEVKQ